MVRKKFRYYLCELIHEEGRKRKSVLHAGIVKKCLTDAIERTHGDYGAALLLPTVAVVYFNDDTNMTLIRVGRAYHHMLASAMFFIKMMAGRAVFLKTIHLGGTIRSCKKYLLGYQKQQLPSLLSECQTKAERDEVQQAIVDSNAGLYQASVGFPRLDNG